MVMPCPMYVANVASMTCVDLPEQRHQSRRDADDTRKPTVKTAAVCRELPHLRSIDSSRKLSPSSNSLGRKLCKEGGGAVPVSDFQIRLPKRSYNHKTYQNKLRLNPSSHFFPTRHDARTGVC